MRSRTWMSVARAAATWALAVGLGPGLPSAVHAAPVASMGGMVATAHAEASRTGLATLRLGGSACDAAVAAAFALAVVEPYSSGIGGGGFALVHDAHGPAFLDFRETAPAAAHADMFMRDGKPQPMLARDGGLAVAVPSAVRGFQRLHAKCGRLPWAKVVAPAIELARRGFTVDLRYQQFTGPRLALLTQDPVLAATFLRRRDGGWALPPVGTKILQPQLAHTLSRVAADGGRDLYEGQTARAVAAATAAHGGILTASDLAAYAVQERPPLVGHFRGQTVITAPLPSAGGIVLLMLLHAMETFPPGSGWHDLRWLQLFAEVSRQAFADRALLGDPAGLKDGAALTAALTSPDRAKRLAAAVLGQRAAAKARVVPGRMTAYESSGPTAAPERGEHTTHLVAVDREGHAVSLTTTLNDAWGAGFVAGETGIVMNNEMDDFAVAEGVENTFGVIGSVNNAVHPGRTPLSSMTPTLVFDGPNLGGPLRLAIGAPGGARIPTSVAHATLAHLDSGADVRTAVGLGRLHHQHTPDELWVEPFAVDPLSRERLKALGYAVQEYPPWCNVMAVAIDNRTGVRTAAADPRGVGEALGE